MNIPWNSDLVKLLELFITITGKILIPIINATRNHSGEQLWEIGIVIPIIIGVLIGTDSFVKSVNNNLSVGRMFKENKSNNSISSNKLSKLESNNYKSKSSNNAKSSTQRLMQTSSYGSKQTSKLLNNKAKKLDTKIISGFNRIKSWINSCKIVGK